MGPKEALFIDRINQYLIQEVLPKANTFDFPLNYPETTEFDVTTLRATHLETYLIETHGQVEEIEVLKVYFATEAESDIAISIDMYNRFDGLFNLDNYFVCYDSSHGVWLDGNSCEKHKWIEYLLNENCMGDWLYDSLEDVMSEVNIKNVLPLEDLQLICPDIRECKVPSTGYFELIFNSGASFVVSEEQVLENIMKMKNKMSK